jgi:mannose-6-phosphate isomerase-like protein (cupin superfamily)
MIIKKEDSVKHANSPECTVYEYPTEDKDINVAFAEIRGRYPSSGYAMNECVKEILFVKTGNGKAVIEDEEHVLNEGDMLYILPGKKYFLEGTIDLIIPCTPAWHPSQHKHVTR